MTKRIFLHVGLACAMAMTAGTSLAQGLPVADVFARCEAKFPIQAEDVNEETVEKFIVCVKETGDLADPRVLILRAALHRMLVGNDDSGQRHYLAMLDDYCEAARLGHVRAQNECAAFKLMQQDSPASVDEGYKWLVVAAFNGWRVAQGEMSFRIWPDSISNTMEFQYNRFATQYLSCHPAMFQPQRCSRIEQSDGLSRSGISYEECVAYEREVLPMRYKAMKNCRQEHVDDLARIKLPASTRKEWEHKALAQEKKTLQAIREQIKRFPELAELSLPEAR